MKGTTGLLLTAVACALLSGCASTSESSAPAAYPTLKVLSDTPYVWDDSISEALNVARMAQPAGVGNGMRDFADGKLATTGRIGGGTRAIDAGLGLLSQGLFGVVSMEALNAGVNRQLDWKSAVVDFMPVKNTTPDKLFLDARNLVEKKILAAMKSEFPSVTWYGAFTPKRTFENLNTEFIFFDKEGCKQSILFESTDKSNQKMEFFSNDRGRQFVEKHPLTQQYCVMGGKVSVAGTTVINGENNYIVVYETAFGQFFDSVLAKKYDGYFLMPDYYQFRAVDSPLYVTINRNYASVFKSGTEIQFMK